MSVGPVVTSPAATPRPEAAPAGNGTGFAEALASAAAGVAPASLPSVSLGVMVHALATGVVAPQATTSTNASVATATIGNDTGMASATGGGASGQVLTAGEKYLGVPYVWGGTDPEKGFDCSGFVQRVFADLGVSLPRVSIDQSKAGTAVPNLAEARPGDLVFWYGDGSRPNHIGIYAGNDRMLVAPSTGDVVRYQELSRTPHEIRRIV